MKYSINKYTEDNWGNSILTENVMRYIISNKDAFNIGKKMIELAKIENGQGLAANQIGVKVPIFVMLHESQWRIFYRPIIIGVSQKKVSGQEGCLSLDGIIRKISRPKWIQFSAIINDKGKRKVYTFHDISARIFQHEYEHLLGITILSTRP